MSAAWYSQIAVWSHFRPSFASSARISLQLVERHPLQIATENPDVAQLQNLLHDNVINSSGNIEPFSLYDVHKLLAATPNDRYM